MKYPITAKRLREALNDNNMKAQELADKTGINKASISQYINGSHAPSNLSAGKMAEVLNVSPLWLMGFEVIREVRTENKEILDKMFDSGEVEIAKEHEKKALELYEKYTKADPNIKAAIEALLKGQR